VPVRVGLVALAASLLLAGANAAAPPNTIELAWSADSVAGAGWSAETLHVKARLGPQGVGSLAVAVARLRLDRAPGAFVGISVACHDLRYRPAGWSCTEGVLEAADSPLGPLRGAQWEASFEAGRAEVRLRDMALPAGRVGGMFTLAGGAWEGRLEARNIAVEGLQALLRGVVPAAWDPRGRVSLSFEAAGDDRGAQQVTASVAGDDLTFASPDGGTAADGLGVDLGLEGRRSDTGWVGEIRASARTGQAYVEPLFMDFGTAALSASCRFEWPEATGLARCARWTLDHAGVLAASGSLTLDAAALRPAALTVRVRPRDASAAYTTWVQPLLIGSPVDDLRLRGDLLIDAEFEGAGPERVQLRLDGLDVTDTGGAFALTGLRGDLRWRREGPPVASRLVIGGGAFQRLAFEGFDVAFQTTGDRFALTAPVTVPLLGGSLRIGLLNVGSLSGGASWETALDVEALSLEALTGALGWPSFTGTLEGRLPHVRYADGALSTGEGLVFRAFGGVVDLADVEIRDTLGPAPVLSGSASLRGLDLERVTGAFAFGRIEGRMDGELDALELVGWQPSRFDLQLYTAPDDPGRRRISQRAVENLTELGSGVPAGLSSTVLRLFEDFRYERIEVGVELSGDVALLSGIARPDGGYYLVKGSGVPRIDVIGRNREVAWKQLIQRLRDIRVEGVQIE
jgi:hypothetical protein